MVQESCQKFSRIKPEIYQTKDGKVIVEDELLNFIVVKLRTLSHDDVVSLATSSFSSEKIEASKTVLSELFPNSIRWVVHRGQKKDINNVKMCLQVVNECGQDIPRFVSHFLDELPAVLYNNMDVSALLCKMLQINADIDYLKRTVNSQVAASETLRVVSATLDERLTAVEKPPVLGALASTTFLYAAANSLDPLVGPSTVAGKPLGPEPTSSMANGRPLPTTSETDSSQPAQTVDIAQKQAQSPAWSKVVRDGR